MSVSTDLIRPADVAQELGVEMSTLRSWRSRGRGPKFVGERLMVRYPREAIDAYKRELGWLPAEDDAEVAS